MKKLKYCGLTRHEDIQQAVALGVDAIGLVFYPPSPRAVSIEQAKQLAQAVPAFTSLVALVVNISDDELKTIAKDVAIDVIQFHGDETPEFCRQFARPYIKAVRVQNTVEVVAAMNQYQDARAVLFDAYVEGEYGGTGQSFDWALLPESLNGHWVLSGGLTPENVAEAIRITGAKIVDISSGVESAAGVKSAEKMAQFIQNVQH